MELIRIDCGGFYLTTDPEQIAQAVSSAWAWYNYPPIKKKMIYDGFPTSRTDFNNMYVEMTGRFPSCLVFAIEKEQDQPFGIMSFDNGNIHIIIDPGEWGKGYGERSIVTLLDQIFTHTNAKRVGASYPSKNRVIHKLLYTKLGFWREGILRKAISFRGEPDDVIIVGMLKEEWLARRGEGATVTIEPGETYVTEKITPPPTKTAKIVEVNGMKVDGPEIEKPDDDFDDNDTEFDAPPEPAAKPEPEKGGLYPELKMTPADKARVAAEPGPVGTEIDLDKNAPLVLDTSVITEPE